MNHTPGPWKVTLQNGNVWYDFPVTSAGNLVALVRAAGGPPTEAKANARLIAKAPEMIALIAQLAGTIKALDEDYDLRSEYVDARALLREIKGETS